MLSESADVTYKCTTIYHAPRIGLIRWNDPGIGVEWPLPVGATRYCPAPTPPRRVCRLKCGLPDPPRPLAHGVASMIRSALILGASGQLGTELQRTVPAGVTLTTPDLGDLDICDSTAVARTIAAVRPEAVFNCAAFTNVDGAESARDEAMAANGIAPGIIAAASAECGARLLHISTDYVFDGRASTPYRPDAPTAPLNVYGESKLEGERRVPAANKGAVIVRTAWLHSGVGGNFVKTAVRVLGSGTPMRVVDDQIGTPTRARHLAQALWSLADKPAVDGNAPLYRCGHGLVVRRRRSRHGNDALGEASAGWRHRRADRQQRTARDRPPAVVLRSRQARLLARDRLRAAALARGSRRIHP